VTDIFLLDTSVAVEVRDQNSAILSKISELDGTLAISAVTRVELEGGVYRLPEYTQLRRSRLDILYTIFTVLPFGNMEAAEYGAIVKLLSFSRRKILDRMIAAQALVAGATLVTLNPEDFAEIERLEVLPW
jgi:tRNA(fMet)-specific endonuclease VapC